MRNYYKEELKDKLVTDKTDSVLELADKTKICKYCGKKLNVYKVLEQVNNDTYEVYECNCQQWKKSIELNAKLQKLNEEFKNQYNIYSFKRFEILREYEIFGNLKVNVDKINI